MVCAPTCFSGSYITSLGRDNAVALPTSYMALPFLPAFLSENGKDSWNKVEQIPELDGLPARIAIGLMFLILKSSFLSPEYFLSGNTSPHS